LDHTWLPEFEMKEVIQKFSSNPDFSILHGGQGDAFRSGNLVIKKVFEPEKYRWYAELLSRHPFFDVKYSRPVRSLSGSFIEEGYGATQFLDGEFIAGRMKEKIQASKTFNRQLKDIPKPKNFNLWISPWTRAQNLAWNNFQLPVEFDTNASRDLGELFRLWKPIDLPVQLIHVDLSGNILFDGDVPVIIDFTPGFFPKEYAEVLLLSDSIAWFDEPLESLDLLPINKESTFQMLLRAVLFRLSVPLFFDPANYSGFIKEYRCFKSVINILKNA